MKRITMLLSITALTAFLGACSSGVKLEDEAAKPGGAPIESRGTPTQPGSGSTASGGAATPGGTGGRAVTQVNVDPAAKDPLNDPAGVLAKRSIYFDFDSFSVKDEYRGLVEAHSKYLNTEKARRIVIQGNTDERGSREYNLALGQKRAEAVRKAMGSMGVGDAQVEAVSFGEEKPRATSNDEAGWAENRRADIVYR